MKSVFIINESMSRSQLDQCHMLILAMLNFEHHVDLVFTNNAFQQISNDNDLKQQWLALKLYGVGAFYCLNPSQNSVSDLMTSINQADLSQLINQADWVS